jgi:transposase-like protein
MAIRINGIMVKCPECESTNIIVIEINMRGEVRECRDCGKQFDSPYIKHE